MGSKEATWCDQHWVLHWTDETSNNDMLYLGYLNLNNNNNQKKRIKEKELINEFINILGDRINVKKTIVFYREKI